LHHWHLKYFTMLALCSLLVPARAAVATVSPPSDLRLNYLTDPLGVDDPIGIFTWVLPQDRSASAAPPQQLSARVIVVSASDESVAFDSGLVATDQPLLVNSPPLPPMSLRSDAVYTWWVEGPLGRSANATFTTGILSQQEWAAAGAQWIRGGNGSTQMRKDFLVPAGGAPARATLFIAACQYYTLFLDGAVLGEQRLDGPWTNFYTNRSYTALSLPPSLLAPGPHTLGLRIGQGFCANTPHDEFQPDAERSGIVLLQLHADDDSVGMRVVSDGSWQSSSSPILSDSTYLGVA
jgi:alpha-L-rhamnosidase